MSNVGRRDETDVLDSEFRVLALSPRALSRHEILPRAASGHCGGLARTTREGGCAAKSFKTAKNFQATREEPSCCCKSFEPAQPPSGRQSAFQKCKFKFFLRPTWGAFPGSGQSHHPNPGCGSAQAGLQGSSRQLCRPPYGSLSLSDTI